MPRLGMIAPWGTEKVIESGLGHALISALLYSGTASGIFRITLKGFLGANAVEHTNSNQKPIVVLSLATKSSYKGKRSSEFVSRTDWHRVVAFGRLAESTRTLTKGTYVEVEGQLQSREYVSGETKRRASEVRARSITKLEHTPRSAAENLDAEPVQDEVPA